MNYDQHQEHKLNFQNKKEEVSQLSQIFNLPHKSEVGPAE
jgi:hypothetical protein